MNKFLIPLIFLCLPIASKASTGNEQYQFSCLLSLGSGLSTPLDFTYHYEKNARAESSGYKVDSVKIPAVFQCSSAGDEKCTENIHMDMIRGQGAILHLDAFKVENHRERLEKVYKTFTVITGEADVPASFEIKNEIWKLENNKWILKDTLSFKNSAQCLYSIVKKESDPKPQPTF